MRDLDDTMQLMMSQYDRKHLELTNKGVHNFDEFMNLNTSSSKRGLLRGKSMILSQINLKQNIHNTTVDIERPKSRQDQGYERSRRESFINPIQSSRRHSRLFVSAHEHLVKKIEEKGNHKNLGDNIRHQTAKAPITSLDKVKNYVFSFDYPKEDTISLSSSSSIGLNINYEDLASLKYDFLEIDSNSDLVNFPWAMFEGSGVVEFYNIKREIYDCFIDDIKTLYDKRANPFHNFKHGLTVMNVCYSLLVSTNLGEFFCEIGTAALMFASLVHDADHTGRNNIFEVNSQSPLALVYNDDSVLENHHISIAFEILNKKGNNIFENMPLNDFSDFRKYCIVSVLSTDIKKHFGAVKRFKERLDEGQFEPYEAEESIEDFILMIEAIVHSADLYVPILPNNRSLKWSELVNQEFMEQSEFEKSNNLPLTPYYMDLDHPEKRANSEKFFVSGIVEPLWCEVNRFLSGAIKSWILNIHQNKTYWEEELIKAQQAKTWLVNKNNN